jgi:hypothetical protein
MTKAQQTWERINALVEAGTTKADAFKQLAEEYGQPVDSVRGAYYGHKRVAEGSGSTASSRRPRKRETTTQDAILSAVATLQNAIDAIAREVEAARERADEARAEYEAIRESSGPRIEEIRAKIAVLAPDMGDEEPPAEDAADATTEAASVEPAKPAGAKRGARKEGTDS